MDKIKSITANIAFIHTIILKTLIVFLLRQNRQNIQFYYRSIMSLKKSLVQMHTKRTHTQKSAYNNAS